MAEVNYATPTLTDNQVLNAHESSWIARKLVEIPAYDSLRKWRSWEGSDTANEITAMENMLGVQQKMLRCACRHFCHEKSWQL